jgi:hypothetical protein
MSRLRKLLESIAYAGMKPGSPAPKNRARWLGPLAGPLTRFLDGAKPDDPFYLTNRTVGQRLRLVIVIAIPCLVVAAGIALAMSGYFDPDTPTVNPAKSLTPEQVAAKMLPNLDKNLRIEVNRDVEISDVHIEHGATTKIAGLARNNTDHPIENAELVFDLTDKAGSRMGAVTTRIPKIDGKKTAPFSFTVEQQDASFALVREIRQQ